MHTPPKKVQSTIDKMALTTIKYIANVGWYESEYKFVPDRHCLHRAYFIKGDKFRQSLFVL